MQQIAIKAKQKQKKRRNKRLTCFQCFNSSIYDSEFNNPVIKGRVYCQKWLTVVQIGCARSCPYFEDFKEATTIIVKRKRKKRKYLKSKRKNR
jgi:hypothetical protein